MTNKLYAKPILENRFWILESDGKKVGTICKQEDRRYMFSCESGTRIFDTVTALEQSFTGDWMWGTSLSAPGPPQTNIGLLIFSACNIDALALFGDNCLVLKASVSVVFLLGILYSVLNCCYSLIIYSSTKKVNQKDWAKTSMIMRVICPVDNYSWFSRRDSALFRPYFRISPENNINSIAFFSLVTITPSSAR